MSKYIYQKFLLNCNYEVININDFPVFEGDVKYILDYRCDYCLFDINKTLIPIIQSNREATLKAYLYRFQKNEIKICLA
ncbi:hypothetical protein [Lachnospira multipara]|uniref:hypothetical protein n=1 Tax=Lachnospira multipara TaxID=28051 RepID=UPI000486BDFF|nr:hypothetical protein [Lachnospira multipara]